MDDDELIELIVFLEYCPDATVLDVMVEFDVSEEEALEMLKEAKEHLQLRDGTD